MKRIIYTIIMVLLFISSIILFIQEQAFKREINVLNGRITDLERQKQELESKLPVGWKEYRDEKYKFKVWYPGETIYKILIFENNKDPAPYIRDFEINEYPYMSDVPRHLLGIYIYKDISDINKFIQEETKKELKRMDNANKYADNIDQYITQVKVSDIDGYKIELAENVVNYYIKKDNLIFNLSFNNSLHLPEFTRELKPYFDQMIQSFSFID